MVCISQRYENNLKSDIKAKKALWRLRDRYLFPCIFPCLPEEGGQAVDRHFFRPPVGFVQALDQFIVIKAGNALPEKRIFREMKDIPVVFYREIGEKQMQELPFDADFFGRQ